MKIEDVAAVLAERCPEAIEAVVADAPNPTLLVKPERWHDVASCLQQDARLRFDWLRCISAVDHIEEKLLTVLYHLHATQPGDGPVALWSARGELAVKVRVPRDNPHVRSVADIWPAADWHEREAFDLVGVIFDEHPDLRRILCCEDWVGHPLRRDYEFPMEYHGIPAVTEFDMTRPQH
ncbi:MAG: NADH-quinone oxidoreductase subunit C [Planctomycetes bacterium]|nr:NADH-quinone oxidoreductase subunit C [Planctomycetota bacterium]